MTYTSPINDEKTLYIETEQAIDFSEINERVKSHFGTVLDDSFKMEAQNIKVWYVGVTSNYTDRSDYENYLVVTKK
jgi:hypothetical protein